jgi:hypothetical protein
MHDIEVSPDGQKLTLGHFVLEQRQGNLSLFF